MVLLSLHCFPGGKGMCREAGASFTAFLEERGGIEKLEGRQMDLSPLFLFSMQTMQRNST